MIALTTLKKHYQEIRRALTNHKWDRDDRGNVAIGRMGLLAAGVYNVRVNKGPWSEDIPNILPVEGLIVVLGILGNHISIPSLYLSLYATALTPISTHTGASYTATFGEITSGTEGYTEATRVAWTTAAPSVTAILNNYASPATFTIATASTLNVNGVAMLTTSAKGDTSGKLVSATRFSSTRTFSDTDEFDIKYQIGLSST